MANALGVDWSQLVELQQKQKNQEDEEEQIQENGNATDEKEAQAEARRKRWTPIAIFNRIGIPRSYLSDTFYNSFVKKLNDTAQGKNTKIQFVGSILVTYISTPRFLSFLLCLFLYHIYYRRRAIRTVARYCWFSHAV